MARKRLSLGVFQKIAADRGGRCLSTEYIGANEKLEFECAKGHIWTTAGSTIKNRGSWCPDCSGNVRLSLDVFQKIASERGGRCLSTEYTNMSDVIEFECAEGHVWTTTGFIVKTLGSWCPECAIDARRLSLGVFQKIAAERGGRCLSTEYSKANDELTFECSDGHIWTATGSRIKNQGSWCPDCSGNVRLSLDVFQKISSERGGRCLSTEYTNMSDVLEFECAEGHVWTTTGRQVKSMGQWCPDCSGNVRLSLDVFQKIASERGGRCLSTEYSGANDVLTFECSDRHIWTATGASVKNKGTWCPDCASARGEKEALSFTSKVSGLSFKKTRPKWLRSPRGGKMELDGYCESAGLAIEYQGGQHYTYIPSLFHKEGPEAFAYQLEKDRLKAELVAARGILLLPIRASQKADQVSVRRAVMNAAEDACFPLLGVNREFTEMCVRMGRPPMHRFSACLPYAAFLACVGE